MANKKQEPGGALIPSERITRSILLIRVRKVLLDADLAALYEVETRVLTQAVRRNLDRFPEDFMFQLTKAEFDHLRSQSVTSSWGGRRYPPYAFTEFVKPSIQRTITAVHKSRPLAAMGDALLPRPGAGELRIEEAERFIEEYAL